MKEIEIHSLEETKALGLRLAKVIKPGMLFTLNGDLGAGKTTFTKALGEGIGVKKTINSPTFTILKIYQGRMPLYHIDAYRLEGIQQDLGFDDYFEDDGLCVIEWANYIENQLPKERLEITIRVMNENEDSRRFTFVPFGKKYEAVVEAL
ncbi:MAG: tRNA (adenosine(37)-N6)-threonylcarbamoyltransferase complex ATPase subunit type 1 TsaE [Longicatena sp.]